jgi:hypothetical protein
MTFVGEAQSSFITYTLPGFTSENTALTAARDDGQSAELTAGDDLLMSFRNYDYLEADSAATFELVFVVLSGSASVRVTYGGNEDYEYETSSCTLTAGTFTMAAGDNLVDLSEWTGPWYHAADELPLVRVEVLSGSLDLDQIRLRIWPPGGYRGGWSDVVTPTEPLGPYDVTGWTRHEPKGLSSVPIEYNDPAADADRDAAFAYAQQLARAELDAVTTAYPRFISTDDYDHDPLLTASGGAFGGRHHGAPITNLAEGATMNAQSRNTRSYLQFDTGAGAFPPGTEGVDWVRHPDLTPTESVDARDPVGDPVWEWDQDELTWIIGSGGEPLVGGYYLAARYVDEAPETYHNLATFPTDEAAWTPIAAPGTLLTTVTGASLGETATPPGGARVALPPIDGPVLELEATVGFNFAYVAPEPAYGDTTDPETPIYETGTGGLGFFGGIFATFTPSPRTGYEPVSYYVTPAPYRYWSPARRIPLRQFHRDDGLGVTPPRAFGGGSRIRTGRAFGYD